MAEPERATARTPQARRWALAACAIAATQLIVSTLATRGFDTTPPDAQSYLLVARSLLDGEGYTVDYVDLHLGPATPLPHVPEMHGLLQPFPFAALMAILGEDPSLVRIPGFVYIAGAALAAALLAYRAFGPLPALVACLLVATNLRLMAAATLGADDVGFAFLFTCMLAALSRAMSTGRDRDFAIAGMVAGIASWMKPLGLFQPLVFASIVILWRPLGLPGLLRRAVALGVPFLFLSCAYVVRNWLAHGGTSGRVSPLNVVQKTLGVEGVYRLYDPPPTLIDVVREVGPMALVDSAVRQLGKFAQADVLAAFTNAPTSAVGFSTWFPGVLMLAGVIAFALLCRRHREISALYAFSLLGAVGFVCILWHYEPRYLALLVPIGSVMIAGLLAPEAAKGGPGRKVAAAIAATLTLFSVVGYAVAAWQAPALTRLLDERGQEGGCDAAYDWIRSETDEDDAILGFHPWDVAWSTRRSGIVIPSGGPDAIATIARRYDARWLIVQPTTGRNTTRKHTLQALAGAADMRSERVFGTGRCRVYRLETAPRAGSR